MAKGKYKKPEKLLSRMQLQTLLGGALCAVAALIIAVVMKNYMTAITIAVIAVIMFFIYGDSSSCPHCGTMKNVFRQNPFSKKKTITCSHCGKEIRFADDGWYSTGQGPVRVKEKKK